MNKSIAFIGAGNMGGAMASCVLDAGDRAVIVFDPDAAKRAAFAEKGAKIADSAAAACEAADYILLAVKPQIIATVLEGLRSVDFTGKTLLVATGVPRKIGLPGEADLLGQGVSYCATCDGMFYKGKQVAVIGSFHEAVEDANFLAGIAERVDYFPEQRHETGALLEKVRMKEQKVLALEREENKILIRTGEENFAYDGVFVLRPAVALGQLIPKMETENGRIITDADGRTNLPRIYAAGDAAGAPYQMAKAAGEGNRAALAMAKEMDAMEQGGTE